MAKKKTISQIIVHKTQHRKLKTKQHELHQKLLDMLHPYALCYGIKTIPVISLI